MDPAGSAIATVVCAVVAIAAAAAAMFGALLHAVVLRPRRERGAREEARRWLAGWSASRGWSPGPDGAHGNWRGRRAELALIANVRRSRPHRFLVARTWLNGDAARHLSLAPHDVLPRSSIELRLELTGALPPPRVRCDPGLLGRAGLGLEVANGHEADAAAVHGASADLERAHAALQPHGLVVFAGRVRWEQPGFALDALHLDAVLEAQAGACDALEQALDAHPR